MRATRCGTHAATVFFFIALLSACGDTGVPAGSGDMATVSACTDDAQCAGATPRCDRNSGKCVACLPLTDNCPKGQRCVAMNGTFACTASCGSDMDCPKSDAGAQLSCCNSACVDTTADTGNCGGCGKMCPEIGRAHV